MGMTDVDPRTWANEIAGALSLGGERIPFQRVLQAQGASLVTLRKRGLTWQSLASLLLRAGVQRPDGQPYSADHLRVLCARLTPGRAPVGTSEVLAPSGPRRVSRRPARTSAPEAVGPKIASKPVPATPALSQSAASFTAAPTACADKDVSADELAAARARLRHTR
jgi:hypothetical protein